MFIKIPVFWAPEDFEEKESCMLEVKFTIDVLVVNTDQICGYYGNDKGETMIYLSNGNIHRSPIAYKQFDKEFPDLVARMELVIGADTNVQ